MRFVFQRTRNWERIEVEEVDDGTTFARIFFGVSSKTPRALSQPTPSGRQAFFELSKRL
jgi:hypothetical protein